MCRRVEPFSAFGALSSLGGEDCWGVLCPDRRREGSGEFFRACQLWYPILTNISIKICSGKPSKNNLSGPASCDAKCWPIFTIIPLKNVLVYHLIISFVRACQLWCPSLIGQPAQSQNPRLASMTSSSTTCSRLGMVREIHCHLIHFQPTQNMQTVPSWLRISGRTINSGRGSLQRRRGERMIINVVAGCGTSAMSSALWC